MKQHERSPSRRSDEDRDHRRGPHRRDTHAPLLENGRPRGAPNRIALPVVGDDSKTKTVVMKLVDDLGFDAVDAGSLDESWRQQPGTPVYGADLDATRAKRALADAPRERPVNFRA